MSARRARGGDVPADDGEEPAGTASAASTPPARLEPPIGQGSSLARMLRAARRLRLPQALVVGGSPGSGKSTIARWLAAALLCPSDLDQDGPCGVCRACRRVASGQHPDLHVLQPEEGKREIAVDAVRELRHALARLPVEAQARVVIVDPASALNDEGQNALLKTLEEPGSDTFLLLPTARPELLLPTVRSRCERLGVRRLDDDTIARELLQRAPERKAHHGRALAMARGSLGAALQACTEQAVQLQDLVHELCDGTSRLRPLATARAVLAARDGDHGAVPQARSFVAALRTAASARIRALASSVDGSYVAPSSKAWTTLLELALSAEQDLDLQIPPEQALVGLLVRWSRVRGTG